MDCLSPDWYHFGDIVGTNPRAQYNKKRPAKANKQVWVNNGKPQKNLGEPVDNYTISSQTTFQPSTMTLNSSSADFNSSSVSWSSDNFSYRP